MIRKNPPCHSILFDERLREEEQNPYRAPGVLQEGENARCPLEAPHEVQGGNDLLNILIRDQGKDYYLPEFAKDQLAVSANRYSAMF